MNDVIVKVNDDNVVNVTHADAVDALKRAGTKVVLVNFCTFVLFHVIWGKTGYIYSQLLISQCGSSSQTTDISK